MIFENKKEADRCNQFLKFNFDDLIIISILFILYAENLQGSYIFTVLICILLS